MSEEKINLTAFESYTQNRLDNMWDKITELEKKLEDIRTGKIEIIYLKDIYTRLEKLEKWKEFHIGYVEQELSELKGRIDRQRDNGNNAYQRQNGYIAELKEHLEILRIARETTDTNIVNYVKNNREVLRDIINVKIAPDLGKILLKKLGGEKTVEDISVFEKVSPQQTDSKPPRYTGWSWNIPSEQDPGAVFMKFNKPESYKEVTDYCSWCGKPHKGIVVEKEDLENIKEINNDPKKGRSYKQSQINWFLNKYLKEDKS